MGKLLMTLTNMKKLTQRKQVNINVGQGMPGTTNIKVEPPASGVRGGFNALQNNAMIDEILENNGALCSINMPITPPNFDISKPMTRSMSRGISNLSMPR